VAAIEQEILEQISTLNESQKQLVLALVKELNRAQPENDWFDRVHAFHDELRAKYGDQYQVGVQDMLDELREEASWPRSY
jgi:hypothetical protein